MTPGQSRRAELIAAAVADDLTDSERQELSDLEADDPSVTDEIREMRETAVSLSPAAGLVWVDAEPGDLLRRRVTRSSGRARRTTVAAVAAGIAVGVAGVFGAQSVGPDTGAPSDLMIAAPEAPGSPGELGAFEAIDFTESSPDVSVDGGLVAHTWGTETVLEMQGVPVDETFEVVLVDRTGADRSSGSFLGSAVTIDCRMNAAVLRPDVAEVEIRAAEGQLLARAPLPAVGG